MKISKFVILGERCSGTNFLEETLLANFNLEYSCEFGNKHFFCFNNYSNKNYDDTLFIGIIRNPIYWLNSFSKELHHIPEINRKSIFNFLFNKFYSVNDEIDISTGIQNGMIIFNNSRMYVQRYDINKLDLNYLTNDKYSNIFEMRKIKNNYLIYIMPQKVKNYILINYEDLLYNSEETLSLLYSKYNLNKKNDNFIKINKYKKSDTYKFVKQRLISFPPQLVNIIWNNLDENQENKLGYFRYDDNKYFKIKYKNIDK